MGKHTEGPWKRVGTEVYFPNILGGFSLARCPDAEGNAALCSAAPELLEALELADAALSGANMDMKVVERKVKAAIAKARGEA